MRRESYMETKEMKRKKRLEPEADARSVLSIARGCCSVFCEETEGEIGLGLR